MTEIEIKIECLYTKRYKVQLAILKPSEQGRWPSHKEFWLWEHWLMG